MTKKLVLTEIGVFGWVSVLSEGGFFCWGCDKREPVEWGMNMPISLGLFWVLRVEPMKRKG